MIQHADGAIDARLIQAMAIRITENSPLAYRKLKDISIEHSSFPDRGRQ